MQIADAVREVRDRYIRDGLAPSYYQINNGLCDEFAADVIALMGGYETGISELVLENFMTGIDGDPSKNDILDWSLLEQHWAIDVPAGFTKAEFEAIDFGGHVWVCFAGKHYDAECPEGVHSFFDLPFYKRHQISVLRELGCATEEVMPEDVVPPPLCDIPNPVKPLSCAERFLAMAKSVKTTQELIGCAIDLSGILSETGDEDHDCYLFQNDGTAVCVNRSSLQVEVLA